MLFNPRLGIAEEGRERDGRHLREEMESNLQNLLEEGRRAIEHGDREQAFNILMDATELMMEHSLYEYQRDLMELEILLGEAR